MQKPKVFERKKIAKRYDIMSNFECLKSSYQKN